MCRQRTEQWWQQAEKIWTLLSARVSGNYNVFVRLSIMGSSACWGGYNFCGCHGDLYVKVFHCKSRVLKGFQWTTCQSALTCSVRQRRRDVCMRQNNKQQKKHVDLLISKENQTWNAASKRAKVVAGRKLRVSRAGTQWREPVAVAVGERRLRCRCTAQRDVWNCSLYFPKYNYFSPVHHFIDQLVIMINCHVFV